VYPNVNTVQHASLFDVLLEAETRASRVERAENSVMVTEILETCEELRKKAHDQVRKQSMLGLSFMILRMKLEMQLRNAAGGGTGCAAETVPEGNQP
jgi:hypothetical protein